LQPWIVFFSLTVLDVTAPQLGIRQASLGQTQTQSKAQPNMTVKLKDERSGRDSNAFFTFCQSIIGNWSADSNAAADAEPNDTPGDRKSQKSQRAGKGKMAKAAPEEQQGSGRRRLGFREEADVFLIPSHCEYSVTQVCVFAAFALQCLPSAEWRLTCLTCLTYLLQRGDMWHSRAEFVEMVERNLNQVHILVLL
jgi:hypothetical protein